jgi:hypothetical protein
VKITSNILIGIYWFNYCGISTERQKSAEVAWKTTVSKLFGG